MHTPRLLIGLFLGLSAFGLAATFYPGGLGRFYGDSTLTNLVTGAVYFNTASNTFWVGGSTSNPVKVGVEGVATTGDIASATGPLVLTNDTRSLVLSNVAITGSLILSNTTWDDLRIPMSTARAGASVPNYSVLTNGVYAWHFVDGQTDTLFFETQLPHTYATGSDLRPHIHWTPTTSSTNSVVWAFEYTVTSIHSNFPATVTMTATASCDVAMKHYITSFGTITGTGLRPSAVLVGRISRLGTDDADTFTGDAVPLSLDIHFQQDKVLGSNDEIPD